MARLNSGTISRRTVEGLPMGERETVFWDRELSGFGVRVYPSGSKVYLVQTRAGGKSRRVTIGRHGLLSAEQARRKAAAVIAGIKAGEEPSRNGSAAPSATGPALAGCVKTPTSGHEGPIRHSRAPPSFPRKRESRGPGGVPTRCFPTPPRLDSRFRGNGGFGGRCLLRMEF